MMVAVSNYLVYLSKISGSALILGASFYFAYYYNGQMKKRIADLNQLILILEQIKSEMDYGLSTLPEAFENMGRGKDSTFSRWIEGMTEKMQKRGETTFFQVWNESLVFLYRESALCKQDIEHIRPLGKVLCGGDTKQSFCMLDRIRNDLQSEVDNLTRQDDKQEKVVLTISMFCGFLLLICLI